MKKLIFLTLTTVLVMAAIFAMPHILPALAAPPDNDDFYSAIEIPSLPFTSTIDSSEATTGLNDPSPCGDIYPNNSVWYSYTPLSSGPVLISTEVSNHDLAVGVYTGDYNEGLTEVICSVGAGAFTAKLDAGVRYSIMIVGIGSHPYPPGNFGGTLQFELTSSPPPENDDFDNAKVVSALPYSDAIDTRMATWASDDPSDCWISGSVWYALTPQTNMTIEANTVGSDYDTSIAVYTGERGALVEVPDCCARDYYEEQDMASFQATANTTYYFMVGRCCEEGGHGGGQLVFNVLEQFPPPNDDFADAIPIKQLPFFYEGSNLFATIEGQEPYPSCAWKESKYTVWFKHTATQSGTLFLQSFGLQVIAVYEGNSLEQLHESGCSSLLNQLAFQIEAGRTYYIQLGNLDDRIWNRGDYALQVDWAPPPEADFHWYPNDPNRYDKVGFSDYSKDPAGLGFIYPMMTWGFGDGSTASGEYTSHNYSSDGDYAVQHGIVTIDGRTDTITKTISIRTHDVAITKFLTPKLTLPGQTRKLAVVLRNNNYPEEARVNLYKKTAYGYQFIDYQWVSIPVSEDYRTMDVIFNYTFTDEDARLGRVTFKVVVYIYLARDVNWADNEAISKETRIITFKTIPPVFSRFRR